jgi:hypothetical protein
MRTVSYEFQLSMCTELFANRVDERRNMINDYLRRELALRVLGKVDFRGSVNFELLC